MDIENYMVGDIEAYTNDYLIACWICNREIYSRDSICYDDYYFCSDDCLEDYNFFKKDMEEGK